MKIVLIALLSLSFVIAANATSSSSSTECINGVCKESGTYSGVPYSKTYRQKNMTFSDAITYKNTGFISKELKNEADQIGLTVDEFVTVILKMN